MVSKVPAKKKVKTTAVEFEDREMEGFKDPSKYYIVNAMGNYIYFHCKDRAAAQLAVDMEYGKGKYTVRSAKMEKGSGDYTCTGTNTRRGFATQLRPTT